MYNAIAELFDLLHMILIAPRKLYEELFEKQKTDPLKNLSLCGRKVVSWSEKISDNHVTQICKRNHVTPNEVYFSAASSALSTFLEEFKNSVPSNLGACARYVEKDFLLGNGDYSEGVYKKIQVFLRISTFFVFFCYIQTSPDTFWSICHWKTTRNGKSKKCEPISTRCDKISSHFSCYTSSRGDTIF